MARKLTVTVYEVIYDGAGNGAAGDGTHIARFGNARNAEAFASGRTCYGRPTKAERREVPRHLAERWGVA